MRINEPEKCPHCGVSLLGERIPMEYISKKDYKDGARYKREIGVEYPDIYDGVWYFRCPDCDRTFGGEEERRRR